MRDIELVSQLLLAVENGPASSSQAALDTVTAERDEAWPDRQEIERRFQATIDAIEPVARAIGGANHRLKNQVDFDSMVCCCRGASCTRTICAAATAADSAGRLLCCCRR